MQRVYNLIVNKWKQQREERRVVAGIQGGNMQSRSIIRPSSHCLRPLGGDTCSGGICNKKASLHCIHLRRSSSKCRAATENGHSLLIEQYRVVIQERRRSRAGLWWEMRKERQRETRLVSLCWLWEFSGSQWREMKKSGIKWTARRETEMFLIAEFYIEMRGSKYESGRPECRRLR